MRKKSNFWRSCRPRTSQQDKWRCSYSFSPLFLPECECHRNSYRCMRGEEGEEGECMLYHSHKGLRYLPPLLFFFAGEHKRLCSEWSDCQHRKGRRRWSLLGEKRDWMRRTDSTSSRLTCQILVEEFVKYLLYFA